MAETIALILTSQHRQKRDDTPLEI